MAVIADADTSLANLTCTEPFADGNNSPSIIHLLFVVNEDALLPDGKLYPANAALFVMDVAVNGY